MASTLFTGASRYSSDFGAVIERQVGIASLALTQMEKARQTSNDRITAVRWLAEKIKSVQSTLAAVESSVNANAVQSTSSDPTAVRVTAGEGVSVGQYTLQVTSLGAYSAAVSKTSGRPVISDPTVGNFITDGVTQLTLKIVDHDGDPPVTTEKTIDLTSGNSLKDVVNAINSNSGLNVQAAIVNLGTTTSPNYALSLQSTKLGKLALQLNEGSTSLMQVNEADAADPTLGSKAEYKINGATLSSDTRTVTLAPQVTAELLRAEAGRDVSVSIERGTSAFQNAIGAFINAYNVAVTEIDKLGGKGGALAGDSLIGTVRQQLRSALNNATGSGALDSMAKIGVEFTSTRLLSFNSSLFSKETAGKLDDLKALIGTATTSGFMKSATDALNALSASSNGVLTNTITSLDISLKAEDARIEAENARIEQFTRDLQERLAKADALIAQLEQQANYFNSMFEAMRVNQKSMS